MKIYCDYCGTQIDTDKNNTCPHCGAAFAEDEELKEALAREKKAQKTAEINTKFADILNEFELRKKERKAIRILVIGGAAGAVFLIYFIIRTIITLA